MKTSIVKNPTGGYVITTQLDSEIVDRMLINVLEEVKDQIVSKLKDTITKDHVPNLLKQIDTHALINAALLQVLQGSFKKEV